MVEIFNFAKDWDEQHPPKESEFYLVSVEGAIGLCCHVEYMVKWLFIPMEPGTERDALVQEMEQQLDKMAAEEEAAEQATPPPYTGVPPTMTPPPYPGVPPAYSAPPAGQVPPPFPPPYQG